MIACHIRALIKRSVLRFPFRRGAPFSSSSAANHRFCSFLNDAEEGSVVYRHALKFQRPTTIKWLPQLANSVNLIGLVDRPLQELSTEVGGFGAHTMLRVSDSREPNRTFRVSLIMWDKIAERCIAHLKPNELIYVWGWLKSFTKVDESGKNSLHYGVIVKELNYVARPGQESTFQKSEESQSRTDAGKLGLRNRENKVYLWQVFFSNPFEWWDNRKVKSNPRQPDFKHKDTGEALWLSPHDPPWIKRQLQLLDSKMTDQGVGKQVRSRSRVSQWVYDE